MVLKDYEYIFARSSMDTFFEYDQSNFISNAMYRLSGNISAFVASTFDAKSEMYMDMIDNSLSQIQAITVNTENLIDFYEKIIMLPSFNSFNTKYINYFSDDEIISTINGEYIRELSARIANLIIKLFNNKMNDIELNHIISSEISLSVKKQIVKTNLPYSYSPSDLYGYTKFKPAVITKDVVKNRIVPFLNDIDNIRRGFIKEGQSLKSAISHSLDSTSMYYNSYITKLHTVVDQNELKKINKLGYYLFRSMLEVCSFSVYMFLRKLHIFQKKIELMMTLSTDYSNYFIGNTMKEKLVSECGIFNRSITSTSSDKMTNDMLQGEINTYDEISSDVYKYYRNIYRNNIASELKEFLSSEEDYFEPIEDIDYDVSKYREAFDMFVSISDGIDEINERSKDFILIVDDIVKNAGFSLPLEEKFARTIEGLDDITFYQKVSSKLPVGSIPEDYFRIMKDVHEYKMNMKHIANAVHMIKEKLDTLQKKIQTNINSEYSNDESIKELNRFLQSLQNQYVTLTSEICKKFMTRLTKLTVELEVHSSNLIKRNDSSIAIDNMDYSVESLKGELEAHESVMDYDMREIFFEYKRSRIEKEHSVRVIFEEVNNTQQTSNSSATTTQTTNNNKTNNNDTGKVKVTEIKNDQNQQNDSSNNQNQESDGNSKVQTIVTKIKQFLEKMRKDFVKNVKRVATENQNKWFTNEAKEALKSRGYSNVQGEILPYDKMDYKKIITDLGTFKNNVKSMTSAKMKSINNQEQLCQNLFGFIQSSADKNFKMDTNGKVNNIEPSIRKYYKVGSLPLQTVIYKNNDLKQFVLTAIDYCSDYGNGFLNSLDSAVKDIETAFEEVSKGYSGDVIDKLGWLRSIIQTFTGAIYNAARDRYNDEMKLLYPLVPKKKAKTTVVKTGKGEGEQQNQQTDQTNNQNNQNQ